MQLLRPSRNILTKLDLVQRLNYANNCPFPEEVTEYLMHCNYPDVQASLVGKIRSLVNDSGFMSSPTSHNVTKNVGAAFNRCNHDHKWDDFIQHATKHNHLLSEQEKNLVYILTMLMLLMRTKLKLVITLCLFYS